VLHTSKGKLIQTLDNLILNSDYWIRREIADGKMKSGEIRLNSQGSLLTIWDNGPGIDPKIEPFLFQPFQTTKPKHQGRGLGLFIVKHLVESMDCTIRVLQDRNINGRLYKFEIDLKGAVKPHARG
jgi:C4-dicarboxylate-specific signal transduction histidine kinase